MAADPSRADALETFVDRLDQGGYQPRQHGNNWTARCPGHDDRKASLSISRGNDGRIIFHCFVCGRDGKRAILDKLNLGWRDISPSQPDAIPTPERRPTRRDDLDGMRWWATKTGVPEATWLHLGAVGEGDSVAFTFPPSHARKFRNATIKGWWEPKGAAAPPFWPPMPATLPERVIVTAGESDCGTARHLGFPNVYAVTKGEETTPPPAALHELRRRGARQVVVAYDVDTAGAKGTQAMIEAGTATGLDVLVPDLVAAGVVDPMLGEKDLNDGWKRSRDADAFRTALQNAIDQAEAVSANAAILPTVTPLVVAETNSGFHGPRDIVDAAPDSAVWRWHGYVAEGAVTLLSAREKAGKSTLLAWLVKRLLRGEEFLGQPTIASPVIWLSEEPPSALREKLERFGLADLDDDQLRFKHRVDVRGRPDLSAIIEEVRHEAARTGAKVVIVDTLGFWGALPKEAENDAGAMREVMTYFTELASYGLAVIVVHHMSKLGEARGSTAIVANVDIALEMKREGEHDRRRKLEGIGRYEATPRSLIIELTEADDYRVLGIPAQISHKDREATVYDALPDSGHGLTQDDIAQMTTITRQRVGDALQALIMRGSVLRLGSGKKGDPFRYRQVAGPAQQFVSATTRGVGGGNTAEMAETEMEVF